MNMRLEQNLLLFDHPPLAIDVKKPVKTIIKKEAPRKIIFAEENASPLFIEFFETNELNTLQYYYDLKYVAENNNLIYVGPVYFGEKEWAKVVHADMEGFLVYGYIALKDNQFLYVYMVDGLGPQKVKPFAQYQLIRKIPEAAKEFVNSRFKHFNTYCSIRY